MKFELPKIEIEKFNCDSIMTLSGISDAAKFLADEMSETATGGVNVIKWIP